MTRQEVKDWLADHTDANGNITDAAITTVATQLTPQSRDEIKAILKEWTIAHKP